MRVVVVVEDGENETTFLFDRTTANAESVDLFIKCISLYQILRTMLARYSSIPPVYTTMATK